MKKANEYLQLLKIAYPKADAIYEDAIIEICHRFFARAYMVINPRSMKRTIDRAREDKKIGRFRHVSVT